jgi:hypothetical protein
MAQEEEVKDLETHMVLEINSKRILTISHKEKIKINLCKKAGQDLITESLEVQIEEASEIEEAEFRT